MGTFSYKLVMKAMTGVFGVASFAVWTVKNFRAVVAEVQDTQPDEFVGMITQAATVELPKLWAAFQEPPELPLA